MSNRLPVVRLVAEVLVIVASILLAFGIDAWWGERQERIEETEILQGLREEFDRSWTALEKQNAYHSSALLSFEALLAASHRGSWESKTQSIDEALGDLIGPPTTDLGSGVLDALVGAGKIQILSNQSLRTKLASWKGVFEEAHDDEVLGRNFVFDRVVPYLAKHGVPLSGAFDHTRKRWRASIADDADALSRLLADPEFHTILEVRYGFASHTTGEYESAMKAIAEILAEIERSLSE